MSHIRIVAPSSRVPEIELGLGVRVLQNLGFEVSVDGLCSHQDHFYSGSHEDRAAAFFDAAMDPKVDIIWCARGGYGATHLLPLLDQLSKKKKPMKKTLIGFSDATALLTYTRQKWKWNTLHGLMPTQKKFSVLEESEMNQLFDCVDALTRTEKKTRNSSSKKLQKIHEFQIEPLFTPKKFKGISKSTCVGGNLSVWNALIGTPYAGQAKGSVLFLEEISENLPRIARMIEHLRQSGGFKEVQAIVLGDFLDCRDSVPKVFQVVPANLLSPKENELTLLREPYTTDEGLYWIFRTLAESLNIPVFWKLPVGHGPGHFSLPLGTPISIDAKGKLSLFAP